MLAGAAAWGLEHKSRRERGKSEVLVDRDLQRGKNGCQHSLRGYVRVSL